MKKSGIVLLLTALLTLVMLFAFSMPSGAVGAQNQHPHTKGTLIEVVAPTYTLYGYSIYRCGECGEAFLADITEPLKCNAEIIVDSVTVKSGDTFDVEVFVSNNCGFATMGMTMTFANALTLVDAKNGDAFSEMAFTSPRQLKDGGSITGSCRFAWAGSDNITEDGTILVLTFEADYSISEETLCDINIECEAYNDIHDFLPINTISGTVKIIDYIPGDVNGDGIINMLDVLLLCQYYVDGCKYDPYGYAVTINENAGDVDANGVINMLDVLLICQYYVDGCRYDPDGYAVKLLPGKINAGHRSTHYSEIEPTCTKDGRIEFWYCSNCDKYFKDGNHENEINYEDVVLEALGHDEVIDAAVAPTAYTDGLTEGIHCARCGEVLVEQIIIPALGNYCEGEHELKADIKVEPTCSEEGIADVYCENCDYISKNAPVEKLGHTYEWKVKEATLFDDEQYYKQCKECGETEKSTSGTNKGKVKYYDSYDYIDDNGNTQIKSNANTNHAYFLGPDDDTVRTATAKISELKVGATYSTTYVFNGKTYTYTIVGECSVDHKKQLAPDYVFIYKNGSKDIKNYLHRSSTSNAADGTVIGYDGDSYAFFADYAMYRDIADLYKLTECTNPLCEYSKKEVIFEKVGHVYDNVTFEIKTVLREGEAPFEYRVTFNGYDNETYKCGIQPVEEKLCAYCFARAKAPKIAATLAAADPAPTNDAEKQAIIDGIDFLAEENSTKIVTYLGAIQAHKYVSYCQNSECEGNEHVKFQGSEYYVCTNCEHEHWDVCMNKDNRVDEDGLCYMYYDSNATGSDATSIVYRSEGAVPHVVERNAEEFLMPATCVDKAYLYNKCKVCGAPVKIPDTETGDIDPNNHDWTVRKDTAIITLQAATCKAAGRRAIYCNRYDCNAYIIEEIPVDAENGHALYTRDANGRTGLSKAYIDSYNAAHPNAPIALDAKDVKAETCTSNRIEKWYCDICKQIIYLEIEDTMLDKNVASNHALTSIVTVAAKPQNCVTGATYAYTYCKDCKTIITIDGASVLPVAADGVYYNIDEDLDKTIIPSVGLLFTPDEWEKSYKEGNDVYEGVFGGDEAIKYEVIADATGNPITYKLTSGGKGHRMDTIPGIAATCYNAGTKDKLYCIICDFVNGELNGEIIERINHKNAQTQSVKAGDEDRVVETWNFPGATGVTNTYDQDKWRLRAIDVRNSETVVGGKDYKIAYVPATCTEDGYVIGRYCTLCMKTINKDGEDVPFEYYTEEGVQPKELLDEDGNIVYELDANENEIPVLQPVGNVAGYKLEKAGHYFYCAFSCIPEELCGEDNYSYEIWLCAYCNMCIVRNFAPAPYQSHKIELYNADNDELGVKRGDVVIYTLGIVNGEYVAIYKKDNGAGYYYLDDSYNEIDYDYTECVDTIYTGKHCLYCGEFFDKEAIEPKGHYASEADKEGTFIDVSCIGCKNYAGLVCASCGYEVPCFDVEKDEYDRDVEVYYNCNGLKLDVHRNEHGVVDRVITGNYFVIEHCWAYFETSEVSICACAYCGINIVNENTWTKTY